jgi:hypothetical protein
MNFELLPILTIMQIRKKGWLKIEQFWPFEEISMFSNGGYLGYRTALTDTILKTIYNLQKKIT